MLRHIKMMSVVLAALALTACAGNNSLPNRIANRAQSEWYQHMVCVPTSYSHPVWSSDGTRIFYTIYEGSAGRTDLRVMNSQGGDDHLVVADAGLPMPSPDGKWLLYAGFGGGFSLLDLATLKTRSLGDLGPTPAWTPDSKSILFTRLAPSEPISLLDIATGNETGIVDPLPSAAYGDSYPLMSPLGDRVAFLSDRGGEVELYIVDADGKHLSRIEGQYDQPCAAPGGSGGNFLMSWSMDGTLVAYTHSCSASSTLDVLSLDEERVLWSHNAAYVYPVSFSPDGSRILLLAQGGSTPQELLVANTDGSGLKSVGTNLNEPAWSPDGQRIAYVAWDQNGLVDIYSMAWDGTDVRKLTSNSAPGVICPH